MMMKPDAVDHARQGRAASHLASLVSGGAIALSFLFVIAMTFGTF